MQLINKQNMTEEHEPYMISSDWVLYDKNNPSSSLNSSDYKYMYRSWYQSLRDPLIDYSSNILLINDGAQVFYNAFKPPSITTIIDPDAYILTQDIYKKHLNTLDFLNTVDSLGHERKLTLLDMTFKEAIDDDCLKTKYSLIFVNTKTQDDINIKAIEKYFSLLDDYGFLCIQLDNNFVTNTIRNTLEHYLTSISEKFKTSSTGLPLSFLIYRKIPNLI